LRSAASRRLAHHGDRPAGVNVERLTTEPLQDVHSHLGKFVDEDPATLVFAGPKGGPLRRSNFQKHWRAALTTAGLSAVHFHDLRHTGNTVTAQAGAMFSDLMARMGHASMRAALIYLHTTSQRDRSVAESLSRLLDTDAVPKRAGDLSLHGDTTGSEATRTSDTATRQQGDATQD
jgi:integrase